MLRAMPGRRVLIVDDHATFRAFARLLLARAGYEVVGEAADLAAARERIAALEPDLVLLDLQLPDGDGLTLGPDLRPRVVLVSSRAAEDYGTRLRDSGLPFVRKDQLSAGALAAALGEAA